MSRACVIIQNYLKNILLPLFLRMIINLLHLIQPYGVVAVLFMCLQGVHIEMPLQAYFRINSCKMGQFERTLIIAEQGSSVHYVEGCSAPIYRKNSLHSAVVELDCAARMRIFAIQPFKIGRTMFIIW